MKIWIIGARGTISTACIVGMVAAQEKLLPAESLLTEGQRFRDLGLPPLDEISFGGCDLRAGNFREAALECSSTASIFPAPVVSAVADRLASIPITRGILRGGGVAIETLAGSAAVEMVKETARDAVARITADLADFAGEDDAVVVNVASTEPPHDPSLVSWDLAMLEGALDANDARIPASALYAYAALRSGYPYVNFTPSTGASLPALVELSREMGAPLAGRDGKTGETLVKTALAPMFAIRALTVEGWYGTNILGNTDGQVLADPENRASKITSKQGVLEQCLGYAPDGDVRIDYFRPLGDHKVAWDFIQFRGWGGHRMRMQFTWEGTDAVLAAPLVIDIARLSLLAQRRGESGPLGALALFFKTPEGSTEMNLHRQYDDLLRWIDEAPAGVEAKSKARRASAGSR
jgi:myo-inositol-1-phosphate synthase